MEKERTSEVCVLRVFMYYYPKILQEIMRFRVLFVSMRLHVLLQKTSFYPVKTRKNTDLFLFDVIFACLEKRSESFF